VKLFGIIPEQQLVVVFDVVHFGKQTTPLPTVDRGGLRS
jgi:hypothetical protein